MNENVNENLVTGEPVTRLPRRELTEPYCRRFEAIIARACTTYSFTLSPSLFPGGKMSSSTFYSRFEDAVRGFSRFRYSSKLIPIDSYHLLSGIRCYRNSDGSVTIENPYIAQQVKNNRLHAKQPQPILALIAKKRLPDDQAPVEIRYATFDVFYDTPDERDWILDQAKEMGEDQPERKCVNIA